jgi:hypothetical protein
LLGAEAVLHASSVAKLDWAKLKEAGGVITTMLLGIIVGGWLIAVAAQLGNPVVYDASGKITLDTFTRSKDILTLLLPFLTTAVGFWLGTQGTGQLERRMKEAVDETRIAHAETQIAQGNLASTARDVAALEGEVGLWRYRATTAEERAEDLEKQLREALGSSA